MNKVDIFHYNFALQTDLENMMLVFRLKNEQNTPEQLTYAVEELKNKNKALQRDLHATKRQLDTEKTGVL